MSSVVDRYRGGRHRVSVFSQGQRLDRSSAGWLRPLRGLPSQRSPRSGRTSPKAIGLTRATSPSSAQHWLLLLHWSPLPGFVLPFCSASSGFLRGCSRSRCFGRLGGRHREARTAAVAVFPAAAGHRRSRNRRRARLAAGIFASVRLLAAGYFLGAVVGLRDRRGDRLVARSPVIGSTRFCGSSDRCRQRPGCRSLSSCSLRASAPASF